MLRHKLFGGTKIALLKFKRVIFLTQRQLKAGTSLIFTKPVTWTGDAKGEWQKVYELAPESQLLNTTSISWRKSKLTY